MPRGVAAVNKLINRDKVFAIVGGLGTPIINAAFKEQEAANVPNMFPLTSARSMSEPLNRLKFATGASYYHQIRLAMKWLVENKQRKMICSLYEDTDFGQEILEGVQDQAKEMGIKVVETAGVKPTDTDFTAAVTKLKNANCDFIGMGTNLRTTIIPMGTAKRMAGPTPSGSARRRPTTMSSRPRRAGRRKDSIPGRSTSCPIWKRPARGPGVAEGL